MSRLIKEDDVIKIIDEELALRCGYDADIALLSVKRDVAKLPTAYDVEKVVEELKEASYDETQDDMNPFPPSKVVSLRKTQDIVRKGGVE
jgi:hypothetical protein